MDAGAGETAAAEGAKASGEASAASGATAAGTSTAAAGTTATAAGTTAATGTTAAAAATPAAAAAGAGGTSLASEAAAAASAGSALYQLSQMGKANLPPTPGSALNSDASVQAAEQAALQRREAAAGLTSTFGTQGGATGSILNPSNMSNRSVLGG